MLNEVVKIMIIDDHPAMGYGTKIMLEKNDYIDIEVLGIADSGKKGLDLIEMNQPDVVYIRHEFTRFIR